MLTYVSGQLHQAFNQFMIDQILISVNLARRLHGYRIVSGAVGWLRHARKTDWTRRCLWVTMAAGITM